MAAFARAPWALRIYAALLVGTALVVGLTNGGQQNWIRVLWAAVFGICVCVGNRFFWWFVVVLNALALVAAPFLYGQWWIPAALSVVGLACLLAPESRKYVFHQAD